MLTQLIHYSTGISGKLSTILIVSKLLACPVDSNSAQICAIFENEVQKLRLWLINFELILCRPKFSIRQLACKCWISLKQNVQNNLNYLYRAADCIFAYVYTACLSSIPDDYLQCNSDCTHHRNLPYLNPGLIKNKITWLESKCKK